VRGGAVTLVSQGLRVLLQLGSTAVLARLLTPADFGLVAMVVAIIGLIGLLKDAGLSMATVQRDRIDRAQVSNLFWANVVLSLAAIALTALLIPAIVAYYGEPRLAGVTAALSAAFLLAGLGAQHRALLVRHMRFLSLASVDVLSLAVGVGAAIAAAAVGAGYWSLVVLHLATATAGLAGVWAADPWLPGAPRRGSGVRPLLAFGRDLTAFNVLAYISRTIDNVLIGGLLGARSLGLYIKAYNLLLLPVNQINQPVTSVALPALSRLQHEPERYRRYYHTGLLLITSLGMPSIAFLFVDAEAVILTVLGEQWREAVPLFRALGPAAFLGTFNVATGWVYLSLGHTGRQLRWQVLGTTVTVTAFVVGLRWGALGVALAYSASNLILRYPALAYCYRGTPVTLGDLGRAIGRPAVASLAAAALLALPRFGLTGWPGGPGGLVLDLVLYGLLYLALWLLLPGGREAGRRVRTLLGELRPRPAPVAPEGEA
jgi:O-antigen/teichoic acid export membrane protein